MDLWFKYGDNPVVQDEIGLAIGTIRKRDWLYVVTHIISRIEKGNEHVRESIKELLISIADEYPQSLVFPLLLAKGSIVPSTAKIASKILLKLAETQQNLIKESEVFSQELIKVAVLLEEQWTNGIREAYKYGIENKDFDTMVKILNKLFAVSRYNSSPNEIGFFHQHGHILIQAREALDLYIQNKNVTFLNKLWSILSEFNRILEPRITDFNPIFLENVSPALLNFKNSKVFVPGTHNKLMPAQRVCIKSFQSELTILRSKRRPRKMTIVGVNGKHYPFLLKGNEDLR